MGDVLRSSREEILSRIEFVCLDLVRQIFAASPGKKFTLRASDDNARKQLEFRVKNAKKLTFNLCTLSQIYKLLSSNQQATKRDLYYDHKHLYEKQDNLDRSVTAICDLLNETRVNLNVLSTSKGIMSGALSFVTPDRSLIDCRLQPVLISEALTEFRLINDAQFVMVVEKDATFQKLLDEGYLDVFPRSILVTAKGYPDLCTRKVLRWLIEQLSVPIFGLFDADPHGLEIMLTYKYGSIKDTAEGRGAFIKEMRWIGLKPSDASMFPIARNQFLPMSNKDFVKLDRIRRRAVGLGENDVVKELDVLREMREKLELEAVSSIAFQFLTKGLLLPRIDAIMEAQQEIRKTAGTVQTP